MSDKHRTGGRHTLRRSIIHEDTRTQRVRQRGQADRSEIEASLEAGAEFEPCPQCGDPTLPEALDLHGVCCCCGDYHDVSDPGAMMGFYEGDDDDDEA